MKKFLLMIAVFLTLVAWTKAGRAATLYFLPLTGEVSDADSLVVEVRLDTEGEAINALEGSVVYPAKDVEILEIFDGGSLLSLWPQKPMVKDGRIDFAGGAPNGYKGDGKLFSMILKPKRQIKLSWDPSAKILLNDGQGTEAAAKFLDGGYNVFSAGEEAIKIVSADHPDQNNWYTGSILTLGWVVKPEFLYSYLLSRDPLAEPDNEAETIFKEGVEYAGLADGIYYFHLKAKSPIGNWSRKSTFRAMIDSASPEITGAVAARDSGIFDGRYFLSFAVHDAASGVAEVSVAEGDDFKNGIWREAGSPYLLKDQKRRSEIKIKARDQAGNETVYTLPASERRPSRRQWAMLFLGVAILAVLVWQWRAKARRKF